MRLNQLGCAAMNEPMRAVAQRFYVAPLWLRLGGPVEGTGRALEVGCGRGAGLSLIMQRFRVRTILGIDFDPAMVERARRRAARVGSSAEVALGEVTAIDAPDGSFDAVFDFCAIHLVPDWRGAIAEIRRVLKPGGSFYFEEMAGRGYRSLLPLLTDGSADPRATGFDERDFLEELGRQGITVGERYRTARTAAYTGVIGDVIGVGIGRAPGLNA